MAAGKAGGHDFFLTLSLSAVEFLAPFHFEIESHKLHQA
jgi:hypothetical protein